MKIGSSTGLRSGTGLERGGTEPAYRLPASAHIGRVRLAVSDLPRSVGFYQDIIGLQLLDQAGNHASLGVRQKNGTEQVLLELEALPGVKPIGSRSRLGLYHTAFLLPSRTDLSAFVQHLVRTGTRFGAGDHLVSEAIYLADPDGLQVEVYADRPRETWEYVEHRGARQVRMATEPVRFDELPQVAEAAWQGAPVGTTVGHVHLYVGDLHRAADFYVEALGLDITTSQYPGALFTSAGGYHHHVGLNVWAAGSPVAGEEDARLRFWELGLRSAEEVERVAQNLIARGYSESVSAHGARAFVDPWGITVALVAA